MRDLKPGDRVKITGPWGVGNATSLGEVGRIAVVISIGEGTTPIELKIYSHFGTSTWCRENLRAMPRRK